MRNTAILLVLAIAAVAAPLAMRSALTSRASYQQASFEHSLLLRQAGEFREYVQEASEYGRFADRVERFIASARDAGVAEEGWNRHQVDIRDREVSFARLAEFLAEAQGGDSYYFLPSKLRIETGAGGVNRVRRRTAAPPGDGVKVSLAGDFLVPVQ